MTSCYNNSGKVIQLINRLKDKTQMTISMDIEKAFSNMKQTPFYYKNTQ